jgi:hypothetical protein
MYCTAAHVLWSDHTTAHHSTACTAHSPDAALKIGPAPLCSSALLHFDDTGPVKTESVTTQETPVFFSHLQIRPPPGPRPPSYSSTEQHNGPATYQKHPEPSVPLPSSTRLYPGTRTCPHAHADTNTSQTPVTQLYTRRHCMQELGWCHTQTPMCRGTVAQICVCKSTTHPSQQHTPLP